MRDKRTPDFAAQGMLSNGVQHVRSLHTTGQRELRRGEEMAVVQCLSREGKIKEEGWE